MQKFYIPDMAKPPWTIGQLGFSRDSMQNHSSSPKKILIISPRDRHGQTIHVSLLTSFTPGEEYFQGPPLRLDQWLMLVTRVSRVSIELRLATITKKSRQAFCLKFSDAVSIPYIPTSPDNSREIPTKYSIQHTLPLPCPFLPFQAHETTVPQMSSDEKRAPVVIRAKEPGGAIKELCLEKPRGLRKWVSDLGPWHVSFIYSSKRDNFE